MTSDNEQKVSSYFNRQQMTWLRIVKRRLGPPSSYFQRILQNKFHLFPYTLNTLEELEVPDYEACTESAL